VHTEDYRDLHTAMQRTLRAARLNDRRYKASGLSAADADAIIPDVMEFAAQPRTPAEAGAWLEERVGAAAVKGLWWALRQYAPLHRSPTGGAWSFGTQTSYVAASTPPPSEDDSDEALMVLVRRYVEAFGPASAADIAQFGLIPRAAVRQAVDAVAGELEQLEGPDGTVLYDVPGAPRPAADAPAPLRLMAMWDSVLLAHNDRSRIIPPDYRTLVARRNGDVLPTVLVDGYVAGVWRPVDGGIEVTAFHPLTDDDWAGLDEEARALVAFLADREPNVYARFQHWWDKLPGAEARVLAANKG
jgi:hypothetical protein